MNKKFLGVLLFFFVTAVAFSAEVEDVLGEAEELMEAGRYYTAFKLLNDSSWGTENPDIVLKKVEIALNYYVSSIAHETFGFKDLGAGEKISALRGQEGAYATYYFPISEVLHNLLHKYPEDWRIHKALGEYYFEVFQNYRGRWKKSDEEVLKLADEHYRIAWEHGVYDFKSLFFLGLNQILQKNYDQAAVLLTEALKCGEAAHPLYATANYNLAYAYLQRMEFAKGLKYAMNSYNLYQEPTDRADAARMVGILYRQLGDRSAAIKYFTTADQLTPGNYYNLMPLLELHLEDTRPAQANHIAERLFALQPASPNILSDIMTSYGRNGYSTEFINLCQHLTGIYAHNNEVLGNLYFHLGFCYYVLGKYTECRNSFLTSREHYLQCYLPNHEVFSVISDYLEHLEQLE
ncbi:MAG TPA: hypothetical protein VIL66_08390 [Bacillota bacterium]